MSVSAIDWVRGLLRRRTSREDAPARETTGGGRHSGDPVEVYRAANDMEAQVVKGFLESCEIPVMLRREALGSTLGVSVGPLAEVGVMVPEPLAAKAMELLEAQAEEEEEEEAKDETEVEAGDMAAE